MRSLGQKPPYSPVIIHADMDAFYASVEQRDRPELRGRPVVVGGTSSRGVVAAASYEARRFGIRSAMPTAQARALCPRAVFLSGDMQKYARISAEIREIFAAVSPEVEPLSLDEAFIDVTASVGLLGPPLRIGELLKERVRAATGLTVSVGIAPGKMVAKIASDLSKPDGLIEVPPGNVRAFLGPLPVGRLWGVGPVTEAALAGAGIVTIGDLAASSPRALRGCVGPVAEELVSLARGVDPRPVETLRGAKSYGEEGTFAEDESDEGRIRGTIIGHAEAVARRLRRDLVRARTVILKVKLAERLGPGRFRLRTSRATLAEPTDDGKTISDAALSLWARHRPRQRVRLLGVTAAGISPAAGHQIGLFEDRERRAALNRALDQIVARFGKESIGRGGLRIVKAGPSGRVKRGE